MRLQNQVCTLEQAKKLKALGVDQKSLFYKPIHGIEGLDETPLFGEAIRNGRMICNQKELVVSAFTVAELGAMLEDEKATVVESVDKTEAESRAEHLIWLLENGHFDLEIVNRELLKA